MKIISYNAKVMVLKIGFTFFMQNISSDFSFNFMAKIWPRYFIKKTI